MRGPIGDLLPPNILNCGAQLELRQELGTQCSLVTEPQESGSPSQGLHCGKLESGARVPSNVDHSVWGAVI